MGSWKRTACLCVLFLAITAVWTVCGAERAEASAQTDPFRQEKEEVWAAFRESARAYLKSRLPGEFDFVWEAPDPESEDPESSSVSDRNGEVSDDAGTTSDQELLSDPNVQIVPEMQEKLQKALEAGESLNQRTGRAESRTETESEIPFQGIQKVFNYLFVGDSRFVGMEETVGNGEASWICETAMGLSWLQDSAGPLIDDMDLNGYAVVLNLGVNDLGNVSGYVAYLQEKVPQWREKGAAVYYMSVNPVSAGASVTNDQIAAFNQTIYENLPPGTGWIDTMNYLLEDGFTAPDGLHYDSATYQKIYQYAMEAIQ